MGSFDEGKLMWKIKAKRKKIAAQLLDIWNALLTAAVVAPPHVAQREQSGCAQLESMKINWRRRYDISPN